MILAEAAQAATSWPDVVALGLVLLFLAFAFWLFTRWW